MDDFYLWALKQAEAIESDSDFDRHGVAEEIRDLAKRQERALESRLESLIEHLIKLKYIDSDSLIFKENERGWRVSVVNRRQEIKRLLQDSPSLKTKFNAEKAQWLLGVVMEYLILEYPELSNVEPKIVWDDAQITVVDV
jgi:hypothetical protein